MARPVRLARAGRFLFERPEAGRPGRATRLFDGQAVHFWGHDRSRVGRYEPGDPASGMAPVSQVRAAVARGAPACGTVVTPGESKPTDEALPAIEGLAIERLLGRGGFGAVYLATRLSDGGKAAVKVPNADADAESIARLELEGDTLRRLGGEYAPRLYDRVLLGGDPAWSWNSFRCRRSRIGSRSSTVGCHWTSWPGGADRSDRAQGDSRPRPRTPRSQARDVFSTDQPVATRIFDFGLVHVPASVVRQDTTVGTFMGTPEYMAPEQLDSSAPVDQRADIYEIGAVLYGC